MKPKTLPILILLTLTWPALGHGGPDFNHDAIADCQDVDSLVAEIVAGTNSGFFDLTSDGLVDGGDLAEWLNQAGELNLGSGKAYGEGDANLDGVVDALDFSICDTNQGHSGAGWCGGDFNADGMVDANDIVLLCLSAEPNTCSDVSSASATWAVIKSKYAPDR